MLGGLVGAGEGDPALCYLAAPGSAWRAAPAGGRRSRRRRGRAKAAGPSGAELSTPARGLHTSRRMPSRRRPPPPPSPEGLRVVGTAPALPGGPGPGRPPGRSSPGNPPPRGERGGPLVRPGEAWRRLAARSQGWRQRFSSREPGRPGLRPVCGGSPRRAGPACLGSGAFSAPGPRRSPAASIPPRRSCR